MRDGKEEGVTVAVKRAMHLNQSFLEAQQERLEVDLDVLEIGEAIAHGEILEQYSEDPRGESCLLGGFAAGGPVHVVLGWARRRDDKTLRIITVYVPRSPKWKDPRTRGAKS